MVYPGREGVEREISASLPCSRCIGETDHNQELLDWIYQTSPGRTCPGTFSLCLQAERSMRSGEWNVWCFHPWDMSPSELEVLLACCSQLLPSSLCTSILKAMGKMPFSLQFAWPCRHSRLWSSWFLCSLLELFPSSCLEMTQRQASVLTQDTVQGAVLGGGLHISTCLVELVSELNYVAVGAS